MRQYKQAYTTADTLRRQHAACRLSLNTEPPQAEMRVKAHESEVKAPQAFARKLGTSQ